MNPPSHSDLFSRLPSSHLLLSLSGFQDAQDAVLCPSYASPELLAEYAQHKAKMEQMLMANDVWMMAHVLLVLTCRNKMPTIQTGRGSELVYPGQSNQRTAAKGFRAYLSSNSKLKDQLQQDGNRGLQNLLLFMYAAPEDRLTAEAVLNDTEWVNPAPLPPTLEPMLQRYFQAQDQKENQEKESKDYTPDIQVVECTLPGRPAGLLICQIGQGSGIGETLLEGDIITHADGRRLLLEPDAARWVPPADEEADDGGCSISCLVDSPAGKELGRPAAERLFRLLQLGKDGRVDVDMFRRKADEELARGLFGKYKSVVQLTVWRPADVDIDSSGRSSGTQSGPGSEFLVDCERTRDSRPRVAAQTPERCFAKYSDHFGLAIFNVVACEPWLFLFRTNVLSCI
jgi:hypothetical protein